MARKRKPRPRPPHTKEDNLGRLSVREFFARFPDEDTCLTHIMEVRYGQRHICGACGVEGTFHKLTDRRAFSCAHCGHHVYPTAGTIFMDTRTPLQVWFYAIYLFVATRHGVSGKELERTLGVTYKTAWRIGHQIRLLMAKADGFEMLKGHVEMDEAYVGGARPGVRGRGAANKTIVFGMAERSSMTNIATALWSMGRRNGRASMGATARGTIPTRSRAFWKLFKDSIPAPRISTCRRSTWIRYLDEFTFRSNHRQMSNAMFDLLIAAV
jgi:transposase